MTNPPLDFASFHSVMTLLILIALAQLVIRAYNIWFHPCAKFPGPWTRAAFQFPFHWEQLQGISYANIHGLHKKYGPVVRLGPDRLSFIASQAWKDIYGFQKDRSQIPKDYKRTPIGAEDYLSLFASDDANHARLRRLVTHAFSETALREQRPLIRGHIKDLFDQFRRVSSSIDPNINFDQWMDRLTFDILSDLTFGEALGVVKSGTTNKMIEDTYVGCNLTPALLMAWDYKIVEYAFKIMFNLPSVKLANKGSEELITAKVNKRIGTGIESRKDFMTYILRHNEEDGRGIASFGELRGLTALFMAAGGEEPSSVMSSVMYYILRNPDVKHKLLAEIRQAYNSLDDISSVSIDRLPFFNAVLQETLRCRPPGSGHFARRTTEETIVDGYVVPANTSVEVSAYAAAHSPMNFVDPDTFLPERYLPNASEKFAHDDRAAVQAFSLGPRACLGKNLAFAIIRFTLIGLLWNFDIEMVDSDQDWENQKLRTVWLRPGLMVRITPRT